MRYCFQRAVTVLVFGLVAVGVSSGFSQSLVGSGQRFLCIEDLLRIPPIPPIPVGCALVDCCPGCPGRPTIDWRVRLAGDAFDSIVLEFENLPRDARRQVRITGSGRWLDDRRLEVRRGQSFVRGLPRSVANRPPVALVRIAANVSRAAAAAGIASYTFEFSVEQLLGRVVVNEFRVHDRFGHCHRPPPPASDVISLRNNVNQDNAVVLLDAQRNVAGPCETTDPVFRGNDERWRGKNDILIGNALATRSCNSEVAVFSQHSAMQLVENVTVWTDGTGDRLLVDLTPSLQVPLTVWVVKGPFTSAGSAGIGDRAADQVHRADDLYGQMNCGLGFQATINDATGNPNAPALLRRKCSEGASLRSGIGFTPGRLNIYYLEDVLREDTGASVRGATCGFVLPSPTTEDRNTILVHATGADDETLAHELGHAFTLAHTNTVTGIPVTNVMNSAVNNRDSFTEGQCFRVNVNPNSALNVNGTRVGPTRNCPDGTTSPGCPALALDVSPND